MSLVAHLWFSLIFSSFVHTASFSPFGQNICVHIVMNSSRLLHLDQLDWSSYLTVLGRLAKQQKSIHLLGIAFDEISLLALLWLVSNGSDAAAWNSLSWHHKDLCLFD